MSVKIFKTIFKIFLIFSLILLIILCLTSSKLISSDLSDEDLLIEKPDCKLLFSRDSDYSIVRRAEKWRYGKNETLTDRQLRNEIKSDCQSFLRRKKYFLTTNDKEEEKFSIAFTVITFKSVVQVERLLRTIYRPWNYYCIHVDSVVDKDFFEALEELTICLSESFNNIINTRQQVNVKWGFMSVLKADLNCMKELYDRFTTWKYLINLTGQEFPLKTNKELVQILKAYNGANNIEGTYKRRDDRRIPTAKMPFPIVWYKGAVHITANRDFIKYIFESQKAKMLLLALEDCEFADEQFFSTLNYNPQLRIPGSFIGDPDETIENNQPNLYFITRLKNWGDYPCLSQRKVRDICIWGVSDLPQLLDAKHVFANKFHEEFQPATLKCLEEWYYSKVAQENLTNKTNIDVSFYNSLIFVRNQFQP